jgi:hypothetical protein
MPSYPTKEDILAQKIRFDDELIRVFRRWKEVSWKTLKDTNKKEALQKLIKELNAYYETNAELEFFDGGVSSYYVPSEHRIYLNSTPSIITALHEFCHHIKGHSELDACVYSINLFKEVFPLAYSRLRWEGHTLKK